MNVVFKSPQTLGNRPFPAGTQTVPDHLYGNQKFKQLVRSGEIKILPRDEAAQKVQAGKDTMNAEAASRLASFLQKAAKR